MSDHTIAALIVVAVAIVFLVLALCVIYGDASSKVTTPTVRKAEPDPLAGLTPDARKVLGIR